MAKMTTDCRIFQKLLEREPFFASPGAHAQRKKGDMVRDDEYTLGLINIQ